MKSAEFSQVIVMVLLGNATSSSIVPSLRTRVCGPGGRVNLPEGARKTLYEDVGPTRTISGGETVCCLSFSCEAVFEINAADSASHFEALSFILIVVRLPIAM